MSMQHKIVNMLDPLSHHNPKPKRSSCSGTLNMIPPWNNHTVKQSMPRSLFQWLCFSELFQISEPLNLLVSLKNANDVHKKFNLVWVWHQKSKWDQFQSNPKLVGILKAIRCIFVPNLEIVTSIGGELWTRSNKVNFDFGVQFDLEGQGKFLCKTIGILNNVFCISGPILVVLAWMGDELSCEQAPNGINCDFYLKFGLEGKDWLPPKTIGTVINVFCIFGPNLVMLARTGDE